MTVNSSNWVQGDSKQIEINKYINKAMDQLKEKLNSHAYFFLKLCLVQTLNLDLIWLKNIYSNIYL